MVSGCVFDKSKQNVATHLRQYSIPVWLFGQSSWSSPSTEELHGSAQRNIWNDGMLVQHLNIFGGFDINTTAYQLCCYSLHLLQLHGVAEWLSRLLKQLIQGHFSLELPWVRSSGAENVLSWKNRWKRDWTDLVMELGLLKTFFHVDMLGIIYDLVGCNRICDLAGSKRLVG